MEKKYVLTASYALRSWQDDRSVLLNLIDGNSVSLDGKSFRLLLLCDGKTDLSDLLSDKQMSAIQDFENRGIIHLCSEGETLTDVQTLHSFDVLHIPTVHWSITGNCNYRCRHCFMDAPEGKYLQLDTETMLQLVDEMAACGISQISITGGEPFVRQDIWQIIDKILQNHIVISQIYTNGGLVTKEILDGINDRGIRPEFVFSHDGCGWHDWLRGVSSAEKLVEQAITMAVNEGFPVSVEGCLHKGNIHDIIATIKHLADLRVSRMKFATIENSDLWRKNCEECFLTDEEYYEEMLQIIPQYLQEDIDADVIFGGVIRFLPHKAAEYQIQSPVLLFEKNCMGTDRSDSFLCNGTKMMLYITPDGRPLPCMPMTGRDISTLFPTISEHGGLKNAINQGFRTSVVNRKLSDLIANNQECAECAYVEKCYGGCRARAFVDTGDLYGKDQATCILWKNGYAEKFKELVAESTGHH